MWPTGGVAAYIVAEHILSPATICVDVHGTYCRQSSEKKKKKKKKNNLRDYDDDDDDDDDDIMMIIFIFRETC